MYYFKYKSKIGDLYLSANDKYLLSVSYSKYYNLEYSYNHIIEEAILQIDQYLNKERKSFDLPILITGTEFQQEVFNELMNIDYGTVKTYKEIARLINNEKAVRAVGGACNINKYLIVVPCHRVISSKSHIHGYAGGLEIKQKLLELESIKIEKGYIIKENK